MSDITRIGVLGGTFDPIHFGHLAAASEVRHVLGLDRVLLVPANAQPLKAPPVASAADRLEMCRLAVADDPYLDVDDCDIVRGGATFTVDTLADLAARHPGADLTFIAGADAVATLDRWKDAERLRTLARFVGVTRPGHVPPVEEQGVDVLEVPSVAVSSTEVRRRVLDGAPIRYLTPQGVVRYIERHDLYTGGSA